MKIRVKNSSGPVISRQSGEFFNLWWEKMCLKLATKGGNRRARAKVRGQFVPLSESSKRKGMSTYFRANKRNSKQVGT